MNTTKNHYFLRFEILGVRNCLCAHLSTLTRKKAVAEPETFILCSIVVVGRSRKLHKKEKEICMNGWMYVCGR